MTKRTTVLWAICLTVLLCGVFAVYHFFREVQSRADETRDLSKMMSVRLIVGEALSRYYEQHSAYPQALNELPLQTLGWGDEGSSARDLEAWRYVSHGTNFTLRWTGKRGFNLFLGGRTGEYYISEDDYPKDGDR